MNTETMLKFLATTNGLCEEGRYVETLIHRRYSAEFRDKDLQKR